MRSLLALPVWRSRGGAGYCCPAARLHGPTGCEPVSGSCRPGKAQPPPGEITSQLNISLFALRLAGLQLRVLIPGRLRSQYFFCVMSFMAQGARRGGQSPPPLYPRAPASNIAAARCLRLFPAGFGSGRGSVRAKHGPQPASMRAAPACRERLSDVEAASTGSFSSPSASCDLGLQAG